MKKRLMELRKQYSEWLLAHRLKKILRRLKIQLTPIQEAYVLGKSSQLPMGRYSGKTLSTHLWCLVRKIYVHDELWYLAGSDPDCGSSHVRRMWWVDEYYRLAKQAGVRLNKRNLARVR